MKAIPDAKMTTIDPGSLAPRDSARILSSLIVPRPIAWISTLGQDGTPNLAPFSYFNAVASLPPTIMVSIGQREQRPKDTLRNIQETGEFVLNIAGQGLIRALNATSVEAPYQVNEFEVANLEMAPSQVVKPPRVAAVPAALETRLSQLVPVEGTGYILVLGQVVCYHLREDLLRENGLVDATLLDPVMRLGGNEYARLGEIYAMERP